MAFDLLRARSHLLPHTSVWVLYIYMGKKLRIHILDIASIIHPKWNLMMSIRASSRHKLAKNWADKKSKMAATAVILKINFRHLFPNLWSLSAEICSAETETEWLLDRNALKSCWSEIHDGRNCSASLNKTAVRAKIRKVFKRHLILGQWPDFKVFAQKCSSNGPPPKLLQEDHDGPISLTWPNRFAYLLLKFQPSSLL